MALLVSGYQLFVLLKNKREQNRNIKETHLGQHIKRIRVADSYTVEVPKQMRLCKELNALASLQYADEAEDLFFIVIDQSVSDFKSIQRQLGGYDEDLSVLENYRNLEIGAFHEDIDISNQYDLPLSYSGLAHLGLQFDGDFEGLSEPLVYYVALVHYRNQIFYLMAWTTISKKTMHHSQVVAMLSSLKPILKIAK